MKAKDSVLGIEKVEKPKCPECGSKNVERNGHCYPHGSDVQRWSCKECGYRFSERHNSSKALVANRVDRQLCAKPSKKDAKKLDTTTETKTVVGEIEKRQQEVKGRIIQYAMTLRNKGRTAETIRTYVGALYTLINKGANLLEPSDVEGIIAKQEQWCLRAKRNYTDWYSHFAKFLHMDWEKPNYKAPPRYLSSHLKAK